MKVKQWTEQNLYVAWFDGAEGLRGTGVSRYKAVEDLWSRGIMVYPAATGETRGEVKMFGDVYVIRHAGEFGSGSSEQAALANLAGCLNTDITFFYTAEGFAAEGFAAEDKVVRGTGKTPKEAMQALMAIKMDRQTDELFDWLENYLDDQYNRTGDTELLNKSGGVANLRTQFDIARKAAHAAGKRLF